MEFGWYNKTPNKFLVIFNSGCIQTSFQLAKWLINDKKMNVFVEEKTLNDSDFDENNEFPLIKSKLKVQ